MAGLSRERKAELLAELGLHDLCMLLCDKVATLGEGAAVKIAVRLAKRPGERHGSRLTYEQKFRAKTGDAG